MLSSRIIAIVIANQMRSRHCFYGTCRSLACCLLGGCAEWSVVLSIEVGSLRKLFASGGNLIRSVTIETETQKLMNFSPISVL